MGPESKEVETRVMIDISVTLREKEHKMKIKVYNTMQNGLSSHKGRHL